MPQEKETIKTGPLHIRFWPVASSYQVSLGQNIPIDGGSEILSPKSDTTCIFTIINVEGCLYVLGLFGHKIIPPLFIDSWDSHCTTKIRKSLLDSSTKNLDTFYANGRKVI